MYHFGCFDAKYRSRVPKGAITFGFEPLRILDRAIKKNWKIADFHFLVFT